MGFKKSKALETIEIKMLVNTVADEDGETLTQVEVSHIFRIPTPQVREQWTREGVRTKGKKVEVGSRSTANFNLWLASIDTVKGYDDLDLDQKDWKKYFIDPIGRIHVDNAVQQLMELLEGEEVELEKKFEPSSELLSGEPRT